jgi:hypothetical protein
MYLRSLISKDDDAVMLMSKRNKTFKARYNEKILQQQVLLLL